MTKSRDADLMRSFWDLKARENATFYVSSYRPYHDQNETEFWEWGEKLAEKFLSESGIDFDGSGTALEIGCGLGRMTRHFARRFQKVHGVDVAPEMISRAGENLKDLDNVTLHVGNGRDLAFLSDGSIDFVFSYITFQHIPKVSITLDYIREAGRVLRPGGHFYFQVNNMPEGIRDRLRIRTRMKSILGRLRPGEAPGPENREGPSGFDHPAWRGSRISVANVRRACREAGLDVLDLRGEGTQYLWVKAVRK